MIPSFRLPEDWRIARTPDVNTVRPDGFVLTEIAYAGADGVRSTQPSWTLDGFRASHSRPRPVPWATQWSVWCHQ